ncbi:MAG: glycosyl hydrolase-related protein [candidate division KSB1 bacterium]|nr:glycosyl hydrolase-related protein [candidate division KSB1 bacterium]MDZ7285894.1 glycosyl hydrolase-related protein [candidate division KSB1 bacterium]MDZ7349929.1 glycosyl hydrolase-related protein [candidate division KSB1 bacterium]MDZ7353720.1 glycosyl hydrolase-related protein [candidate division KSB1 bacterium]MDZ7381941.1 glycosyl hydrolase-related protein [candidate division KSB1 bacterium]
MFFVMLSFLAGAASGSAQEIREWLVLGSFSAEKGRGLGDDFTGNDAGIRPHGGLVTAGKSWRHYATPQAHLDFLDLMLDFFPVEHVVAYAHCYVHSPARDSAVTLIVSYDDFAALRVNGRPVWMQKERRANRLEQDTVTITLQKGWNALLFKVMNGVGEWSLAARFINATGLTVQAETPERLTTIPRADPELIRIRKIEPAEKAIFTVDNRPALQFRTVIYNPQQQPLGACRARLLARNGKAVGGEAVFELHAGEIRAVYFTVPVSAILNSFQASGAWQMRLQFNNYEVKRVVPLQYDARLLDKILGSFEVDGVEPLASNGSSGFRRVLFVPWEWAGMPLYVSADLGSATGTVLINGEQRLFNHRGYTGDLFLTDSAEVAARYEIVVHAGTGHASRAAGETTTAADSGIPVPHLTIAVENLALRRYLSAAALLQQYRGDEIAEQKTLDEKMFAALKARDVATLNQLIDEAHAKLPQVPEAELKVPEVSLIGNAHVDLGKSADVHAGMQQYRATFAQVIKNFAKYPGFHFSQAHASTYWWVEQNDPQLFTAITEAVQQKRWEIVGGSWAESDMNLPAGESLARQFLYGKRYLKAKFGVESKVAWMLDSFGHAVSVPQLLKKSGMRSYVFYQPWESMRLFEWEGLDGSRVLGYRPPEQFDLPLTRDEGRHALAANQRFGWPKAARLYGVGSSPASRDIRLAEDLAYLTAGRANHPAVPSVRMTGARGFFEELETAKPRLGVHRDEINFTARGAWVNNARLKRSHRRSEMALPAAEAFALIARSYGFTYPQGEFTQQWRNVLFNQSQSILAGATSSGVSEDALRSYREATETAKAALDKAMTRIETAINTKSANGSEKALVVYNPLNWPRTDVVEVDVTVPPPPPEKPVVTKTKRGKKAATADSTQMKTPLPYFREAAGARLPAQILLRDSTAEGIHYKLLFLPENVPALGYKVYWLEWLKQEVEIPGRARIDLPSLAMNNGFFTVRLDSATGGLLRLVDSRQNREWMAAAGGLEMLGERNTPQSALELEYDGRREIVRMSARPEIIEAGPLRARLRTYLSHGNTTLRQDYVIYANLPRLELQYTGRWQEQDKVLKVGFPFYVPDSRAMFEIPFGAMARAMNGEEVPMQKWLDLSNEQFGVTVVNDGKYSVDVKDGFVRVTALRGATPLDQGEQQFNLAILPHEGDWKQAIQAGYGFNQPLIARLVEQHAGTLPPAFSFVSIEPRNVVLSALKKAEDDDSWIIRLFESTGTAVNASITLPFSATAVSEVNLIEWEDKPLPLSGPRLTVTLAPWEVKTLKVKGQPVSQQ